MRPFSRRRYDLNHFEWLEQFELLKRLEPFERSEQYDTPEDDSYRSEEHTSELQSQTNLVCRLLPEKTTRPYVPSVLELDVDDIDFRERMSMSVGTTVPVTAQTHRNHLKPSFSSARTPVTATTAPPH